MLKLAVLRKSKTHITIKQMIVTCWSSLHIVLKKKATNSSKTFEASLPGLPGQSGCSFFTGVLSKDWQAARTSRSDLGAVGACGLTAEDCCNCVALYWNKYRIRFFYYDIYDDDDYVEVLSDCTWLVTGGPCVHPLGIKKAVPPVPCRTADIPCIDCSL